MAEFKLVRKADGSVEAHGDPRLAAEALAHYDAARTRQQTTTAPPPPAPPQNGNGKHSTNSGALVKVRSRRSQKRPPLPPNEEAEVRLQALVDSGNPFSLGQAIAGWWGFAVRSRDENGNEDKRYHSAKAKVRSYIAYLASKNGQKVEEFTHDRERWFKVTPTAPVIP